MSTPCPVFISFKKIDSLGVNSLNETPLIFEGQQPSKTRPKVFKLQSKQGGPFGFYWPAVVVSNGIFDFHPEPCRNDPI